MTVSDDYFARRLRTEVDLLAGIDPATLKEPIPHIDGWTVHSVIGHTGWVFRFVANCLRSAPDERPSRSSVGEPPVGPEVVAWFTEAADALVALLSECDLGAARPTFIGPQPARWWLRRVSHEVTMHRWDAQSPAGQPDPIDAAHAVDGIDEVLQVFVPARMQFDTLAGSGETVHLHATDVDAGEWLLELGADEVHWERSHAKGDVAARATASDLLLLLWTRIAPGDIETFGDRGLLQRWQQAAAF